MKIAGLLLIATIVIIVILLTRDSVGSMIGGAPLVRDATEQTYYARQFDELKNTDNVLYRETEEPPEDINDLQLFPSGKSTNSEPLEMKTPKRVKFNFKDMQFHDEQTENKEMIKRIQPYFMSQPEIIYRADGSNYYWDWQFPKQAVSTEFAKDPERFVREHPLEYPSYVIRSRMPNKCNPVPQEQTGNWNYDNYEPVGSYPLTCTH